MKTAIIDRSLSGLSFNEITGKSDVYLYAKSLIEAGADYVEIDLQTLARLPEPTDSDSYIFRIERAEEYQIANALPFAYTLVPLKFSNLIEKLEIPVILEIKTGDADILALLKIVSESIDLTGVALLRLIGDFRRQADDFPTLINKIRMKYAVPIDICPLNTTLGALSAAIAAYQARTDSLTLNFGSNSNFTSLEEFLISMATVHKFIISSSYISGICKAAVMSSLISEIKTDNLKMLMKRYRLSPQRVEKVDSSPFQRYPNIKKSRRKTLVERRLDGLEVEEELSEEILNKLKKHGMDFYRLGKTKKTEKKDDCLN
ncbi:MAG: hypothetical protein FWH08_07255 [Oscillospiraceae bacterium]|nr:hypothetical protein [Oscillospiraceae bacterium]